MYKQPPPSDLIYNRVLFCNSVEPKCSVHCTGLNIFRVLSKSVRFHSVYFEPKSVEELLAKAHEEKAGIVLFEHRPVTMPWLREDDLTTLWMHGFRTAAVLHHECDYLKKFDAFICPEWIALASGCVHFKLGVPLPECPHKDRPWNDVPVVGTFGFMQPHKDPAETVKRIMSEFDSVHIRIHLSLAPYFSPSLDYAKDALKECEQIVADAHLPEVTISTSDQFMDVPEAVRFCWENDLNVFEYKTGITGGRSAAVDCALAARRPIAVTRSEMHSMFHNCKPSVCIEDRSLKEIMGSGIDPLKPIYESCDDNRVLAQIEACLDSLQ